MIDLRDYQIEAIERLESSDRKRSLLVLATGGGKTVVAATYLYRRWLAGERWMFVAHRRELINQSYRKLVEIGIPREDVSIVMGSDRRYKPTAKVQVVSIDTLRSRSLGEFQGIFVDEAHRATAPGYLRLQTNNPDARHIGLTATPYRADGKGLGKSYDEIIAVASMSKLIDCGYLAMPRIFTIPANELPDLKKVRIVKSDYDQSQLSEIMGSKKLVGGIVRHWQKLGEDRLTVVFASSVEHSKAIENEFISSGIPCEHLDGSMPTFQRDSILTRVADEKTRVVVNYGVLTEGWDLPPVKCCILARPTQSLGLYLQMAGRILRPWGSQAPLILDHAGCVLDHGLPQDEREFTLDDRPKRARIGASCKTCPQCFAIWPSVASDCIFCGYKFVADTPVEREVRNIEEIDGELVEVRSATLDERRETYLEFLAEAKATGKKIGSAAHRYKNRFGAWPHASWKDL
jgi:superfamily II DNA or RNA helicase